MKKIFIILITLFFTCTPLFFAHAAETTSLVNCGRDGQDVCTICHLVEGIHGIVQYIIGFMVIVAITVITIAGIMYVISSGGGMVDLAKKAILNTLIGITVVLVAFMSITYIFNTLFNNVESDAPVYDVGLTSYGNFWEFSCDKTPSFKSDGGAMVSPGATGGESGTVSGDEKAVRDQLLKDGKFKINAEPPQTQVGCLRSQTIDGITSFQQELGEQIMITGGCESHSSGPTSHGKGYKIDTRPTAKMNEYIKNNFKEIPVSSTGRTDITAAYSDGKGNMYYRENKGNVVDHWDICYQCGKTPS